MEIQALWYNALRTLELLARKFEDQDLAGKYGAMAEKTKASFNEKYWNQRLGCLYDVVDDKGIDSSIRPNQIFSVSLDFSILNQQKSD